VADHPVKVPQDLAARLWIESEEKRLIYGSTRIFAFANLIAQWAADQELEACCEWVGYPTGVRQLRSARRPKPPTLAEQGMAVVRQLKNLGSAVDLEGAETKQQLNVLEEALTRLAELEAQQ
jgi:hypothetical protein